MYELKRQRVASMVYLPYARARCVRECSSNASVILRLLVCVFVSFLLIRLLVLSLFVNAKSE